MSIKLSGFVVKLGWSRVYVLLATLPEPIPANILPPASEEAVVVGLPELAHARPCKLALSYLYSLEDKAVGSRVRKEAILLLMYVLGAKQIRDVVEKVREAGVVAVISLDAGVASRILASTLDSLGYPGVDPARVEFSEAVCDYRELEEVSLARLETL